MRAFWRVQFNLLNTGGTCWVGYKIAADYWATDPIVVAVAILVCMIAAIEFMADAVGIPGRFTK